MFNYGCDDNYRSCNGGGDGYYGNGGGYGYYGNGGGHGYRGNGGGHYRSGNGGGSGFNYNDLANFIPGYGGGSGRNGNGGGYYGSGNRGGSGHRDKGGSYYRSGNGRGGQQGIDGLFGKVELSFRVLLRQIGHATLNVEVQGPRSERALELRFDPDWLSLDIGSSDAKPIPVGLGRWLRLKLHVDAAAQSYDLSIDGEWVRRGVPFPARIDTLQRLVFRTGPWRGDDRGLILDREPATQGLYHEDLPGAGDKVPMSIFLVDDVEAAATAPGSPRAGPGNP